MNWQECYQSRVTTAQEAVKAIRSGDRVILGHACGEPQVTIEALVDRAEELENVEIVHMVAMGKGRYTLPEYEGHFRHNAMFVGGSTRQAVKEGRADYTPVYFHQVPHFFRNNIMPIDVAMITVTPPDDNGYVSLGVSVDYTLQSIASARTVIAEVNPYMPRTGGNSFVPVQDIDYFVPCDVPMTELTPPAIGEVERAIGRNVAGLIKDGDCLQLGIGAIPDAVLCSLTDKNDLGIHSEMVADGVMNLVQQRVITCRRKNFYPNKIVITFAMGTARFYNWLNNNPLIEALPVDIVNDPVIVAKNDNMVAINSALSVDLLGQVAADTLGSTQFSGVGGQVDFIRGATNSRGGRAIIAMPATAARGTLSRINTTLMPGQAVTTSRYDVDYIVTEYGVAHLQGKTSRERADSLIQIAAPQFRDQLLQERRELYGW